LFWSQCFQQSIFNTVVFVKESESRIVHDIKHRFKCLQSLLSATTKSELKIKKKFIWADEKELIIGMWLCQFVGNHLDFFIRCRRDNKCIKLMKVIKKLKWVLLTNLHATNHNQESHEKKFFNIETPKIQLYENLPRVVCG